MVSISFIQQVSQQFPFCKGHTYSVYLLLNIVRKKLEFRNPVSDFFHCKLRRKAKICLDKTTKVEEEKTVVATKRRTKKVLSGLRQEM